MTLDYELRSTILKVENVSLKFGENQVLRDVNLTIRDIYREEKTTGQIVSLLGPSGIGKTRLFRILAGLDKPDTGSVLIGEEGLHVSRGMVGVVAQHYPLFLHRSILSNLLVAGRRIGLSKSAAEEKAKSLLHRLGLSHKLNSYPLELSGGQRQRAAIAQQFMCSDHFLLMDEPFSGLDPNAVDNVCKLIKEVSGLHTLNTIIIVTHDIGAALAVSDTLWLLGLDKNEDGKFIPGARIQKVISLIDRGLAWKDDITNTSEYLALLREVRNEFHNLAPTF